MADAVCPFCFPDASRIFHAGDLVLGLWDGYPVLPGHALLVPRRHIQSWFEATPAERSELAPATDIARAAILRQHQPDGFNIGVNVGPAAGQTVFHLHLHVIPRYRDDVPDPRGGVRHVLPCKHTPWLPTETEPTVRDAAQPWISHGTPRPNVETVTDRLTQQIGSSTMPVVSGPRTDAAASGERVLQLLDEGRFTATYKYAVLLACESAWKTDPVSFLANCMI